MIRYYEERVLTPEPWEVRTDGELFAIAGSNDWVVSVDIDELGNLARTDGKLDEYEMNKANAYAIAAVPEMIAALEKVYYYSILAAGVKRIWANDVINALVKAKGSFDIYGIE